MICHLLLIHFLLSGAPGVIQKVEYGGGIDLAKARNPFEFGGKKRAPRKKVRISKKDEIAGMIMIKGNRKIAVINGKSYRVGDKFGEFLVTSITLEYLGLSSGKTEKRLYLK